ncbi:MAG: flavin reductase, partial [Acidobacteriales bacterium]|nr:flavin reductase [Terriglobales bacterium]
AGDHTIFIAQVEDVVVREGDPLLFFQGKYRQIGSEIGPETKVEHDPRDGMSTETY